jgi:hypothetical protein
MAELIACSFTTMSSAIEHLVYVTVSERRRTLVASASAASVPIPLSCARLHFTRLGQHVRHGQDDIGYHGFLALG